MRESSLRDAGLRVTRQRLAVLDALALARDAGEHLTVGELTARARAVLGSVSTQAIYDCAEALTAAGLVRRIEPAGSPSLYEARVGDNHHHLVCRRCGDVTDVDCAIGAAPCLAPPDATGFVVDEAEVVFWGTCPRCATAAAPAVSPTLSPAASSATAPTGGVADPHPPTTPTPEELQVR